MSTLETIEETIERKQTDRALALLALTEIMASGRAPGSPDETWRAFISARQSATLSDEEKSALAKRIASMPCSYETDGQAGAAIAHLRYFIPSARSLGGEDSRRGVLAGSCQFLTNPKNLKITNPKKETN